jgi:TonB-linked SusC/RagA family outer membrane protein
MQTKTWCSKHLTSAILLTFSLLLSTNSFAQQITIKERKASLEKVIKTICDKAGYDYIFDGKDFKGIPQINLTLSNASVEEAIKTALTGLPLTYNIRRKLIVIKPNTPGQWVASTSSIINVTGLISDENKKGLHGAVIKIKNSSRGTITNENGFFVINNIPVNSVLIITYIGYKPQEILVRSKMINQQMTLNVRNLDEVGIISNGYQSLPKERATGSFNLTDSALINRRVSANILDRIDGINSGVLFNKNISGNVPPISIRDRSTIFANANPLIVLDKFPYDGDVSNINPQDVKSITILKDAAAASIWGSRAGNGVIVISTKQGTYNQKPVFRMNANVTSGNSPDQYFKEQLNNQEYIEVEQFLFDHGRYNSKISSGYMYLSPAVEIMLQAKQGLITAERKKRLLDSIAGHDNRSDLDKYFYRKSINQQYQMNVSGGGIDNRYYFSMGYDKSLANNVVNSGERYTLTANHSLAFFNNRVQFNTGLSFSTNYKRIKGSGYLPAYPYENVATEDGKALAVTDGNLRLKYVDTAGKGKLLDWHYRPLDELNPKYHTTVSALTNYRINLGANYKFYKDFIFSIDYTFDKGMNEYSENNSTESYYTRNLINTFTQIDALTGAVINPIPYGHIYTNGTNSYFAHYARSQLAYRNEFIEKHAVDAIAGYEIKNYENRQAYTTLFGYDPATATNLNSSINPVKYFPYYYNSSTARIPVNTSNSNMIDRFLSYFANASYTYNQRYIITGSARRDQSNLFGVKSNQKGVPLWSAGLSWNLGKEDFYQYKGIPFVKLRATYGYNGNVDKTTSAYLTTQAINGGNDWGLPILQINNPPNPSLSWEKVKNSNFGIDFGTRGNKLTGTIEYWIKDGIDLIGQSLIAPQTGVTTFKGNSAKTRSHGIDLTLNWVNMNVRSVKWLSTFLFNYNSDKLISYNANQSTNADIVKKNYANPLVGYSYYSLFSYTWRGLDTAGNPLSILSGRTSKDYANMGKSTNLTDLVYSGTTRPRYYGSLLNSFHYKSWDLSVNITYKLDYVFRRQSLNNVTLYQGFGYSNSFQQPDYALRWQKPGDENSTNVPALIYPSSSIRDDIYTYSEILVEKADHIRLQDLRLDYQLNKSHIKNLPFSTINVYFYAANLGIIWKASNKKIDPDYPNSYPQPLNASLGFKANF